MRKIVNCWINWVFESVWVSIHDHPCSINSAYHLFFETTIMGNTADLAMVQKMIIDTLHKDGKSQRVMKGVAVQGVLYQSLLNAKLTGRKKLGRKMCTSNRDDRKLQNSNELFHHIIIFWDVPVYPFGCNCPRYWISNKSVDMILK